MLNSTVCPRRLGPFCIVTYCSYLLYKMVQDFLDIQYCLKHQYIVVKIKEHFPYNFCINVFVVFSLLNFSPCLYLHMLSCTIISIMGNYIYFHTQSWKNVGKSSKLWTFIGSHCQFRGTRA